MVLLLVPDSVMPLTANSTIVSPRMAGTALNVLNTLMLFPATLSARRLVAAALRLDGRA